MYNDYESDCQLIDKLMIIHAGLSQEEEIVKQAGLADQLGGAAQTITQAVKDRVNTYGVIPAIATYLTIPFLSSIWWPLGILTPLAIYVFNIDISALFKSVLDSVQSIISSTGEFTQEDAARVADQSTSSIIKGASLAPLRELEKRGQLVDAIQGKLIKEAQRRKPSVFSRYGILGKIFGSVGGGLRKVLFGGLLRWAIMAFLMGIALFEGPKLFMGEKEEEAASQKNPADSIGIPGVPSFLTNMFHGTPQPAQPQQKKYDLPPVVKHNLAPAQGVGEQYHPNSGQTMWLVPLVGSVSNTLWKWAEAIYPELKGHQDLAVNSASFNKLVSIIYSVNAEIMSSNPSHVQMPINSGLNSWKNVVDRFVGEIAPKIKG